MTSAPTLVLYFAPGACSRVPMILLEESGRAFSTRLVAFMAGEHRAADYLAMNPAGKVPLLSVDGMPIAQNSAILMLLARLFPDAGLLPLTGDPVADARLMMELLWFSADLHPLVTRIRLPNMACDIDGGPKRVRELASAAMAIQLASTEVVLKTRDWMLASGWSALDAYLYWVWFRITGAGFDPAPFPYIAAHYARMETRPSVQRMLAREAAAIAELDARGLSFVPPPVPA